MSLQQTDLKSRLLSTAMVLTGISAIIVLAFGMMPLKSATISPDDHSTVANIHDLTGWIKADCKKMTLADFHLENELPHMRDISRQLAEECISGK